METHEFIEKLLSRVSLDEIDFACDLERVLAEEVKYLRHVINTCATQDAIERGGVITELRARLVEKDAQIALLLDENRFLRGHFSSPSS